MRGEYDGRNRDDEIPTSRPRVRFVYRDWRSCDALGGHREFPDADQQRVFELSDDEFGARQAYLIRAATEVQNDAPAASNPDVEIDKLRAFVAPKPAFFAWPEDAIARLRKALVAAGPGATLHPCFAMSCGLRYANGKFVLIGRDGRETKG